jgi:hypothetical protein
MEKVIYQSPKKHRIIAIQDLLIKNNIPVTGIKLHICITTSSGIGKGSMRVDTVEIERSDELKVPIEEFNEKLNDSQTFEIYIDEQYELTAEQLIDECDEETFFDDCIYKSEIYDEALEIYLLLTRNNVLCDEVSTVYAEDGNEGFLLFIEPEYKEAAMQLIKEKNKLETKAHKMYREVKHEIDNIPPEKFLNNEKPEKKERGIFKYLLPLIIIACILLLRFDNQFLIEIIINKVTAMISG